MSSININIQPIYHKKFNCYDAIIATYANWVQRDYQLLLADAWGFDFNSTCTAEKLGERITRGKDRGFYYLANYHGIIVSRKCITCFDELTALLNRELENGRIAGITIDSFYCPWDKNYKGFHNQSHIILITGIDKTTVNCVDPFYSVQNAAVSISELEAGYTGYLLTFAAEDTAQFPGCDRIIENTIKKHSDNNTFDKMLEFAERMRIEFNYEIEGRGYKNFWQCPIIFRLGRIELARNRYSLALDYMVKRYHEERAASFIEQFEQTADRWKIVRSLLVKGQIKNDYSVIPDAVSMICEISEIERELCFHLEYLYL